MIALLRQHYAYLAAEYGVKRIGLFGSYARGEPTEASDIDLIVEFERPIGFRFVELAEYLEKVLGREVDWVTKHAVERSQNWLRRKEILSTASVIFDKRCAWVIEQVGGFSTARRFRRV